MTERALAGNTEMALRTIHSGELGRAGGLLQSWVVLLGSVGPAQWAWGSLRALGHLSPGHH